MILELVWPCIPVAVVTLVWVVAMRPVLRIVHASQAAAASRAPVGRIIRRAARPR